MITFEDFKRQINRKKKFDEILDQLHKLKFDLYDTDLINLTYEIFDAYIDSHFTDYGQDLIYWWLYEDVPKRIYQTTVFGKEEIDIEDISNLWKYLNSDKETYFK